MAPTNLTISKQKEGTTAVVLQFVYDWEDQLELDDDTRKKAKDLADFLSSGSDEDRELPEPHEPQADITTQTKAMSKGLADFLSDENEDKKEDDELEE